VKFTPKTAKEIAEAGLWPIGEYSFEVIEGADKHSKSGNEMIELKVKVYNDNGGYRIFTDYLLESMAFKLRHAAECCDLLDNYEQGHLMGADFVGKAGVLKIKIEKDKSGQYPDRNAIGDYVVEKGAGSSAGASMDPQAPQKSTAAELDDEIPWA
jgi:hypothetical protein